MFGRFKKHFTKPPYWKPLVTVCGVTLACLSLFQNCGSKSFSAKKITDNSSLSLACFFDGQEIPDGESVTAFLNSTGSCESEDRVCNNGNLSGSYNYAFCTPQGPSSCLFNGMTIPHGDSVPAYLNFSVSAGQTCTSEARVCNDGELSGSYNFSACSSSQFASCNLNGRIIAHTDSVKAYLAPTTAAGTACQEQIRVCDNGALNGSYQYSACTPGTYMSCSFNGQVFAHGQTTTAYQTSTVPAGQTCASQTRTCANGNMIGGSYAYSACTPGANAACNFNGQMYAHGQTVTAYTSPTVLYGLNCSTVSEVKTCNNGAWSGSAAYSTCTVQNAASCTLSDVTVTHGNKVNAFRTCNDSIERTCNNGVLSGATTYQYKSCTSTNCQNGQYFPTCDCNCQ